VLAVLLSTFQDSVARTPRDRKCWLSCRIFTSFLFTRLSIRLSDDALESVLVPLDGLGLVDAVGGANLALAPPALRNTLAGAGHADVEVHAIDTALVSVASSLTVRMLHTQC